MNATDWLNYWQAQAAQDGEKRKADWLDAVTGALGAGVGLVATGGNPAGAMAGWGIGKSVGSVGENAVNHTLTPGNVMGDAMGGIGAYSGYQNGLTPISPQGGGTQPDLPVPIPGGGPGEDLLARLLGQYPMMGFAEGGEVQPQQPQGPVIRSSQDVADFMKGLEEAINGMPGSTYTPEKVNHPTLEMLASVVPDVVKALPAPRQTNSVNKTVGAWLPAAATTFSAPINYGKAQREERNKKGSEAAKALADHRWAVARSLVDSLDVTRGGASGSASTKEPYRPVGLLPYRVSPEEARMWKRPEWANTDQPLAAVEQARKNTLPPPGSNDAKRDAAKAAKAKEIARRVRLGLADPNMAGFRDMKPYVEAELGDFNTAQAVQAYETTKKFLGQRESRLTQQQRNSMVAVQSQLRLLNKFNEDYTDQANGLRTSMQKPNASVLWLASNGFLGKEAGQRARNLRSQMMLMADQIANIFMAGGVPTDKALGMAQEVLDATWSEDQVQSNTDVVLADLAGRMSALYGSKPMVETPYLPKAAEPPSGEAKSDTRKVFNF